MFKDPLAAADMTLFTDGHSHKSENGSLITSHAVVGENQGSFEVLKAEIMVQPASAQLAEMKAVSEACKLAKGKRVNIFTDSNYVHRCVHNK